jgi:excisionase family DNA binding protein
MTRITADQAAMTPRALTTQEVADRLACSRRAVLTMIERGQLPAVRFGRKFIRIMPEALDELIACQTTASRDYAENSQSRSQERMDHAAASRLARATR